MATESRLDAQHLLRRWVLATFGGWLLGIVAVILLGGISEGMHFGNQFPVGLGMGWGVGFAQWRVARKWFGVTSVWMWVSVAAMGMPFILSDITGIMWAVNERFFLPVNVALGASLLGLLEWRILRSRSQRAYWWIITCIVGWMLPVVITSLPTGGHPETLLAMIFNIGVIASGGVVLGVVSGAMLVWILQSRPSAAQEAVPPNGKGGAVRFRKSSVIRAFRAARLAVSGDVASLQVGERASNITPYQR